MTIYRKIFAIMLMLLSITSCVSTPSSTLRFNEIQVLGSHNSYKKAIDKDLMALLQANNEALAKALDYSHMAITAQLDMGLRSLELDVLYDPEGGLYANPLGLKMIDHASAYDTEKMQQPGFKVLHVQDIDFRSHCQLLRECVELINDWSEQHPEHLPIIITVNAKDDAIDRPGFTRPLKFTKQAWVALDAEFSSGFGASLFTPDNLRGEYSTLPEAITHGWPLLEQMRGKIVIVLDHHDDKRDSYVAGHPALKNRAMFVDAEQGSPEAAIHIVNDPIADFVQIETLVKAGYLVRTRADADTVEARTGNTYRRDQAFASGAQIISTDYYVEDKRFATGYSVTVPHVIQQ